MKTPKGLLCGYIRECPNLILTKLILKYLEAKEHSASNLLSNGSGGKKGEQIIKHIK